MTIDERLQFLLQSTESLHASTQQLQATVARMSETVGTFTTQIADLFKAAKQDGENIAALARIAEAHQHRLTDLEGGEQQ
jgi:prefoldin subunit 5